MNVQRSDAIRYAWYAGAVLLAAWIAHLLGPILSPFMFAAVLAYICAPLVEWQVNKRLPRTLAVLVVLVVLLLLLALLVLVLVPLFYRQFTAMMQKLPDWIEWLRLQGAPWLSAHFGLEWAIDAAHLKQTLMDLAGHSGAFPQNLLSFARSSGSVLLALVYALVLIPLALFYFLRDWRVLLKQCGDLIPRRLHTSTTGILSEVDTVLGQFLRAQLGVMLVMAGYYSIALWSVSLEYALPIGIVTGLLVFVPYVGMLLGLALATMSGLTQFGTLAGLIPVWIAFGIGQTVEGMFLTPRLVGDRIGLHPLAVIFALLAFGQLFGFFGVLLALPASAALLVTLRHARARYLASELYKS
jgi:predicted PurR-regulated permease PerM